MFSITVRPLARSKSAVCTATSLIPGEAFRPSRKPFPRSRAADVPAMPSSITTLPFPFNRLATYWAAIFPPATLSDAMWAATVTPFAPRSTVMTGIFAPCTFLMVGAMASLSVGLIAMTATFFWIKSSIWLASRAESFCASSTTRLTFSLVAAACAPSRRSTKNGLLRVEIDRPTVGGAAAYSGKTESTSNTTGTSKPLRMRSPSFMISSAIQGTKGSMEGTTRPRPDFRATPPPHRDGLHWSAFVPPESAPLSTEPPIQEHGQEDDGALHHLLVERIHVKQVQPVVDDTDDECPQDCAAYATFPAGQRCAAQHYRGDGIEIEPDPRGRLRRVQPAGQHDRCRDRQDPPDHIHQGLVRGDVHTGQPRGLFVAADRIDVAAHHSLCEDHRRRQEDQHHDEYRNRDTEHLAGAQPDKGVREPGDRTAIRVDKRQAPADGQHPQRGNEGLHSPARDNEAVDQSQQRAHRQSPSDAHQHRAAGREQPGDDGSR